MRRVVNAAYGWAMIGGWVALSTWPAAAEPPASAPPPDLRIARLIDQLGSTSYTERTEASEKLAALGTQTRTRLEAAVQHEDAEIRLRAKELLARFKVEELWAATPVTLSPETASSTILLKSIAEQSGNGILAGDQYGTFRDQIITPEMVSGGFWPVLDDVARLSGNRIRAHYDARQPGLVVVSGEQGRYPVAYAGPVRSQITSARRVFSEELDYERRESDVTHTFQVNVQMMWEDRFRLVAYQTQPEVVSAVTDSGEALPPSQSSGSGWNVTGSGPHQVTMNLRLHPPSTTAQQLDTLKLSWGLVAVGDMATLEVSDLKSSRPHFQDDVELEIEDVATSPGARCEVTLHVRRDLVMPEPQEVLFQENEIELFDAEGRPFRKQGQTNNLGENGATMKISFQGESSESSPRKLQLRYPRIRSQRNLELVFRHVPLPTGRPE